MELNDACEYVLRKIANRHDGEHYELYPYFKLPNGELVSDNGINPKRIVSEFEKYGISKLLDNEKCELTELGIQIGQGIGFKQYVADLNETKKEQVQKQAIKEVKESEKLDLDIYLGKFNKRIGNKITILGFVITGINLIIVIGGLIISNLAKSQSKIQVLVQEERIEKSIKQLENRILILERKTDSLKILNAEKNE